MTMKFNSIILVLIISTFVFETYAQDSKKSIDQDAMNWDLSNNFMNIGVGEQQGNCFIPITICPYGGIALGTNTIGCGAIADYPDLGLDPVDCSFIEVVHNPPEGSFLPTGVTRVTRTLYNINTGTVIDPTCSFDVTVVASCADACPDNIALDHGGLTPLIFDAEGIYHAADTVSATNTTTSGTGVDFKAGDMVELQSKFSAPANIDFSIEIEDCIPDGGVNENQN